MYSCRIISRKFYVYCGRNILDMSIGPGISLTVRKQWEFCDLASWNECLRWLPHESESAAVEPKQKPKQKQNQEASERLMPFLINNSRLLQTI